MENDRPGFTEAQAQIEKLKKLKEQKDQADKIRKDDEFRFAELPHAVTNQSPAPGIQQPAAEAGRGVPVEKSAVQGKNKSAVKTEKTKKTQRASRLDRRNFDRVKKTVKKIKESGSSMRLSDDMFVNMALEKILDLKLDFSQAKTSEEVRAIIGKIKAE